MAVPGENLHGDIDGSWCLPPPGAREAVHTRSIVCRSFRRDDGLLDIDARFIDTWPLAYNSDVRGVCLVGSALHIMRLRATIDCERRVAALGSAMSATPYQGCAEVNPKFQRIVGLSLGRGFRKALRERLGGAEGCTHVLALLDAVAAAAVQAFASNARAPRRAGDAEPVRISRLDALRDTCWYRGDGPVLQRLSSRS